MSTIPNPSRKTNVERVEIAMNSGIPFCLSQRSGGVRIRAKKSASSMGAINPWAALRPAKMTINAAEATRNLEFIPLDECVDTAIRPKK